MSKTKGNYKRGARGSTEEGDSAPKRANMAASKDPEDITSGDKESETKDKPTRTELQSMLVDIQISISSILLENKQTRKEMAQQKETVLEQKAEIASLKATLDSIKKQCSKAQQELDAAEKHINAQKEEIAELYDLQDQLEQYTRKKYMVYIPENAYTSTEEVLLKLAEALEVPVLSQDIEISHKLPSKGTKPIIVKLVSHKVKTSLYKARVKLKNASISNLFPSSTAAARTEATRIFLKENLASYRRRIVNRANEMRRDGLLLSVWTLDGKIFGQDFRTAPYFIMHTALC